MQNSDLFHLYICCRVKDRDSLTYRLQTGQRQLAFTMITPDYWVVFLILSINWAGKNNDCFSDKAPGIKSVFL